jgi:hypothetical protein
VIAPAKAESRNAVLGWFMNWSGRGTMASRKTEKS